MATGIPVHKLTGKENFKEWSVAMKYFLEAEGLWDCVDGKEADPKKDTLARAKIIMSVDPMIFVQISTAKTSKHAWRTLVDEYDECNLLKRVELMQKLMNTRLNNFTSVEHYVNTIIATTGKLNRTGLRLSEELVGTVLLAGLPDKHKSTILELDSTETVPSKDIIRAAILNINFTPSTDSKWDPTKKKQRNFPKQQQRPKQPKGENVQNIPPETDKSSSQKDEEPSCSSEQGQTETEENQKDKEPSQKDEGNDQNAVKPHQNNYQGGRYYHNNNPNSWHRQQNNFPKGPRQRPPPNRNNPQIPPPIHPGNFQNVRQFPYNGPQYQNPCLQMHPGNYQGPIQGPMQWQMNGVNPPYHLQQQANNTQGNMGNNTEIRCFVCNGFGHVASVCPSPNAGPQKPPRKYQSYPKKHFSNKPVLSGQPPSD